VSYERRVDRHHPSALVFLIDQSASMRDSIEGSPTAKAAAVADQINGLLYELVQRCTKTLGELPRPYFAVSVIGYGTDPQGRALVGSTLGGALAAQPWAWTADLAQHPLRIEERERTSPQGTQRFVVPVWVEALATGGTPMCAAIDQAGRLVKPWCDQYPDSFPPIVINLSDGESTDGDPREWARRLTSLRTNDGETLFFNLDIGTSGAPVLFADRPPPGCSEHTALMWEMSSVLPPFMLDIARSQGFDVESNSRGFGSNADFRSVVTFLNVGTSVGHLLR
jgi:hypothetical protein